MSQKLFRGPKKLASPIFHWGTSKLCHKNLLGKCILVPGKQKVLSAALLIPLSKGNGLN